MFFPDRIKAIGPKDRVLEVGPGGAPYPRADVLLELAFDDDAEARRQRGGTEGLASAAPLVHYDGGRFPFGDKEFDYVICSHVVEHVQDVDLLLSELSRVAARGYIEYPTIYYEYLYNFSVHLNFVKHRGGKLYHLAKNDTSFHDFMPVHRFFYRSLQMGHSQLVDAFKEIMFEGFEWEGRIEAVRASTLSDLTFDDNVVLEQPRPETQSKFATILGHAKRMLRV